jgi:hypothetical protein
MFNPEVNEFERVKMVHLRI